MGSYVVTLPNGSSYDVEADSPEAAHSAAQDHAKQESVDTSNKEYQDAPITSKARMLIGDPINQIVHGMTAGLFDKGFDTLTGKNSAAETQSGADRMGPVATGVARAGGAVMLPSGAPAAVGAIGGGPLVRGMVGAGVAGAEGATYGGINAATSGQDVPAGILAGGAGGALAAPVAQAIGAGAKSAMGANVVVPPKNMTTLPSGRTPSAKDLIDVAAAQATSTGKMAGTAEAVQKSQKTNFEDLLTGKNKGTFTPRQRELMGEIAYGDVGTNASKRIGNLLDNPYIASILGGATSFGTGGVWPGILAAGGSAGAGKLLTQDSAKATQEAVDKLRALMYKQKNPRGPTAGSIRGIGQGVGYGGMLGIEDYLGG